MMKCVIIDDEPMAIQILEDYAASTPFLELARSFEDALEALPYLQEHRIDLLFLDINMPDISGIQFLKALARKPMVIFTTAYAEYAVASYELDAVDYLLKPIDLDRFLKASNKAYGLFHQQHRNNPSSSPAAVEAGESRDYLFVKSGYERVRITFSEVLYIESAKNYVVFVTKEKNIMSLFSMNEILKQLPSDSFSRIHKSYIVNLAHIDAVTNHNVVIGRQELPMGEAYKRDFLAAISPHEK